MITIFPLCALIEKNDSGGKSSAGEKSYPEHTAIKRPWKMRAEIEIPLVGQPGR